MRFAIALAAALSILIATPAVQAAGIVAGSTASGEYVAQTQQPPGQAQIEVDVNREGAGAWWTSPIWIAIGVVALLLLIAIIAMAARGGGGTTVIRD